VTDTYDSGTVSRRWNTVRAKTVIAETITGTLAGNIDGKAKLADALSGFTRFKVDGDVSSQEVIFDGRANEPIKVFQTTLTGNIILNKPLPFPNASRKSDFILTYRASEPGQQSGLFRQSRETFIADLGVPIGAIMPYAGDVAPVGYLLCDGSEVSQQVYRDLYSVIGLNFTGPTPLRGFDTFRLPDLRGRFGLGRDNMSNGFPQIASLEGGLAQAGGGNVDRVPDANADILGGSGGQYNVRLDLNNLPDHSHTLKNGDRQYSVVRVDPSINAPAVPGLGPTANGGAQYFSDSGGINAPQGTSFGNPIGLMNPYLTLNYIIRSGPPII
jgi:microcystin-dependent protein